MANNKPIIVIKKKKGGHDGHHGGAWKVAYADFVTAMMAFFLLMWLLSVTPKDTLKGVATYFTPSTSDSDKVGLGMEGGADANTSEGLGAAHSAASSLVYGSPAKGRKIEQAEQSSMMSDKEKEYLISIMNSIQENAQLKDFSDNINIDVTNEGLRIQIMDSDNRPMFKPNTYELQPYMVKILTVLAKMIKDQPNYISISGHTASIKGPPKQAFDFWGISAMRANEVRRQLTTIIKDDQVARIIGKADSEPFDVKDIYSVKNIRVSITLLNNASVSSYKQSAPSKTFQK